MVSAGLQQTLQSLLVSSSLCWSFITFSTQATQLNLGKILDYTKSLLTCSFLHVLKVIRLHGWGPHNNTPDFVLGNCIVSNLSNDSSKRVQQAVARAA